jgi:hypothetical protein
MPLKKGTKTWSRELDSKIGLRSIKMDMPVIIVKATSVELDMKSEELEGLKNLICNTHKISISNINRNLWSFIINLSRDPT